MKQRWSMMVLLGSLMLSLPLAAQDKKLVMWSHWAQEPVKVNFLQAVAQGFEELYGIPVEVVFMPKLELLDKLVFALDTSEPDLTYMELGYSFAHPRIMRSLADLSDLVFSGDLDPSWQLGSVGDRPNVFIPIEGISHAIYYNKNLFQQAGIILPTGRAITNDEFLDMVRTLREAGMTPIGEGSSDREGKIPIPFINTIFRYAGPAKVEQLYKGTLSFSDPDVVNALMFWKAVVDAQGYDSEKALDLTLLEGILDVVDGKAAMSFCGTYFYSKYGNTERDRGQIGVMDWFTVDQGVGNNLYEIIWGAGFAANARSRYLPEAKRFLEYLMSPEAASLWIRYVQSPYPVLAEKMPEESLYGILATLRTGQQPVPQPFTYRTFDSKAQQHMWQEETRRFIVGERAVDQFIERMNSRME